jgi:hypothetical protein
MKAGAARIKRRIVLPRRSSPTESLVVSPDHARQRIIEVADPEEVVTRLRTARRTWSLW